MRGLVGGGPDGREGSGSVQEAARGEGEAAGGQHGAELGLLGSRGGTVEKTDGMEYV